MENRNTDVITGYLVKILGHDSGWRKPLYNFDVTIGRAKSSYIVSTDPNVSRNHCNLKYKTDGWVIRDLGSVNGTYINDIRIYPNTDVPLIHGSSIYFGPKSDAPEGYRFESVKHLNAESEHPIAKKCSNLKLPSQSVSKSAKRKASLINSTSQLYGCSSKTNNENSSDLDYYSDSSISSLDSLRTRIRKSSAAEKRKRKKTKFSQEHAKSDEENSISLLNDYSNDLEMDEKTLDCNLREIVKNKMRYEANSNNVVVQQSLLKALQKKVNELKESLKVITKQWKETVKENDRLNENIKVQENTHISLKEEFKNLLEEELVCNICTELFIQPVTLGCSHTFCKHCIIEWKKKKKQCPNCREKIESETTVLYMDNFINKAVKHFEPDAIERRLELIKKREEAEKKKPKGKKTKGHGRRRSNPPVVRDNEVELLRSRISEIQSYTDDIQSYVDVIDELINERYSDSELESQPHDGYGICYNCGRSGHFADDCLYY